MTRDPADCNHFIVEQVLSSDYRIKVEMYINVDPSIDATVVFHLIRPAVGTPTSICNVNGIVKPAGCTSGATTSGANSLAAIDNCYLTDASCGSMVVTLGPCPVMMAGPVPVMTTAAPTAPARPDCSHLGDHATVAEKRRLNLPEVRDYRHCELGHGHKTAGGDTGLVCGCDPAATCAGCGGYEPPAPE
jgi:hypothetical protein